MKAKWKLFVVCLIVPLAVGGLSALLTQNNMEIFKNLIKPPLSPPGWLFPVVWTILFALMGAASYLVLISGKCDKQVFTALNVYGLQLIINFFWSIFFFNFRLFLFSFIWLVFLWLLILATLVLFYRISKLAGYLLIPYLLWVTFAGYLNFAIYLLN